MKNVDKYYLRQSAQNIAQSGANLALRQLATDRSWRTGFTLVDMLDGKVTVRLVDTTFKTKYVTKIVSTGITNYGKSSERQETSIAYLPSGFIPAALKAAITTNNPIRTLGNLTIDGREHGADGSLIPGSGTLGIWTTKTLSQSGSSKIGGHFSGVDYVPAKPGNANIIATNSTWPDGYPGSPDSVLGGTSQGFPEGTLKSIAQSGIGGSQYVTNPSLLAAPFRGVTYVELPSGGLWQSMDITGSGILIVHNSAKNAGMKNLNSGTFRGLVIADDVVHIHTNIDGGLICLAPSPSEGNCIGNGNGNMFYSSEAISSATGNAGNPGASGNGSDSGVIAWWE
ncbi:MAG: hypothetical protein AAB344_06765 [Bacteroidota bacterium]